MPKLKPIKVDNDAPEVGPLGAMIEVKIGASNENAAMAVPTTVETVTSREVSARCRPGATTQRIDVPDDHELLRHCEAPIFADAV
jgi:hypothetical protein